MDITWIFPPKHQLFFACENLITESLWRVVFPNHLTKHRVYSKRCSLSGTRITRRAQEKTLKMGLISALSASPAVNITKIKLGTSYPSFKSLQDLSTMIRRLDVFKDLDDLTFSVDQEGGAEHTLIFPSV